MICNSATRDPHYLETSRNRSFFLLDCFVVLFFFYLLYLQQNHQQVLIVPRGVTTDIFLQLGTKLWKEEEQMRAYPRSSTQLMAAASWSWPSFFCQEDLRQQRGRLRCADQINWPLKRRHLCWRTVFSCTSNNACLFQMLLIRALFWAHNSFKCSEKAEAEI